MYNTTSECNVQLICVRSCTMMHRREAQLVSLVHRAGPRPGLVRSTLLWRPGRPHLDFAAARGSAPRRGRLGLTPTPGQAAHGAPTPVGTRAAVPDSPLVSGPGALTRAARTSSCERAAHVLSRPFGGGGRTANLTRNYGPTLDRRVRQPSATATPRCTPLSESTARGAPPRWGRDQGRGSPPALERELWALPGPCYPGVACGSEGSFRVVLGQISSPGRRSRA